MQSNNLEPENNSTNSPPTPAEIAAIHAQSKGMAAVDNQTQRKEIPLKSDVDRSPFTPAQNLNPLFAVKIGYNPDTRHTPVWAPHIENGQLVYNDADVAPYLQPVADLLAVTHGALTDLGAYKAAAFANGEWSEGQAVLKIADAASKAQEALAKRWDAVSATLGKQVSHFEKELAAPVRAAADRPHIATELRAHFKAMGSKAVPALMEAISRGETDSVASVLGAPYQLSGLTAEMHSQLTVMLNAKMNPEVYKRLAAVKAAKAYLDDFGGMVISEANRAVGVTDRKLTQLRAAKTEAERARALLDKRFEIKGI